jgi:hypothetical protein
VLVTTPVPALFMQSCLSAASDLDPLLPTMVDIAADQEGGSRLAMVVTVAKGFDLGYIWKTQAQPGAARTPGGYYISADVRRYV